MRIAGNGVKGRIDRTVSGNRIFLTTELPEEQIGPAISLRGNT